MAAEERKRLAEALGLGPDRSTDDGRPRRVEWWSIAAFILFGTLLVML
ncbi:MAG: hypothetical protein GY711_30595 [bacterium]|nr:hypothetical protein [bacterium]